MRLMTRTQSCWRRTMASAATCLAGAALGFVAIGAVQAAEPPAGAMSSCKSELATYCQGIEAGHGKKVRCLSEHQGDLSPACAATVQLRSAGRAGETQMAQAPAAPSANAPAAAAPTRTNLRACRSDMATLCLGVEKGGGRRIKCLLDNQAKLSPDCAATISAGQQKRVAVKAVCGADAKVLCPKAHGAERLQCLETNKAQLSPGCAAVVDRKVANKAQHGGAAPKQ